MFDPVSNVFSVRCVFGMSAMDAVLRTVKQIKSTQISLWVLVHCVLEGYSIVYEKKKTECEIFQVHGS